VKSSPKHIELTTSGLSADVAPHGAQLMSLKTAEGQELLWQGDPRYWADRAPILFPLIGPVVGGQIHHGRHSYPMPPHGFARGRNFAVSQQTPTSCLLELRDDRETRSHYPFDFCLPPTPLRSSSSSTWSKAMPPSTRTRDEGSTTCSITS
jgi:galactose mutarotase-like enzyme